MIHSSLKRASIADALQAIKTAINGRIISHMSEADLRPSEMAQTMMTDLITIQRLTAYQLDGYTVDDMVAYVMRLGYVAQTACDQDGKLTFTFSKA
jgi:hypothetical protein